MKNLFLLIFLMFSLIGYSQTKVYKVNSTVFVDKSPTDVRMFNKSATRFYFSGSKVGVFDDIGKENFLIDELDSIQDRSGVDVGDSLKTISYLTSLTSEFQTSSFNLEIAKGTFEDISSVFKFGRNSSLGVTEEVIWDGGGGYTYLDAARYMSIVSTSEDDSLNGIGAWDVVVFGLDSAFHDVSEFIALDGTTPVQTTNKYIRVFRSFIVHSGAALPVGDNNLGDISITSVGVENALQAQISEHNGQTLMAMYTIPADKTGYITGLSLNVGQGKQCLFRGKFRNCAAPNCAFTTKYSLDVYENTFFGPVETPLRIPAMTDIIITGQLASASDVTASASFGIILIDN